MLTLPALAVLAQLVSSHAPAAATAAVTSASGISWSVPKEWTVAPSPSSMRLATYRIAPAAGDADAGELAVFYFGPGQGGGVEANVARWQSQLESGTGSQPKPARTKVAGLDITLVTAEGTYASGMPGGQQTPKSGWALRGAIAEAPGGAVFFKLVGPKKTVAAAGAGFDALVKSLRKSERS